MKTWPLTPVDSARQILTAGGYLEFESGGRLVIRDSTGSTVLSLDASSIYLKPRVDGDFLTIYNAAATPLFQYNTNTKILALTSGGRLYVYNDAYVTNVYYLDSWGDVGQIGVPATVGVTTVNSPDLDLTGQYWGGGVTHRYGFKLVSITDTVAPTAHLGFFLNNAGVTTELLTLSQAGALAVKTIPVAPSKRGTGTGTNAQQTIAHGLGAVPGMVYLSEYDTGLAIPYQSAPADITNIYVTAVLNKTYIWRAEI